MLRWFESNPAHLLALSQACFAARGARVGALAEPGEVLVTSTVRDLVAGSGIGFVDRGSHVLRGVPGEWRLLSVA